MAEPVYPTQTGAPPEQSIDDILAARSKRKAGIAKAQEEQRKRDLLTLNDFELEHGDENVMGVHTAGGLVVLKRPGEGAMKRWRETMWSEKIKPGERAAAKAAAAGALAKTCVLHPDRAAYEQLCTDFPGVPDAVGSAAVKFAGIVEEDEGKG